MSRGKGRQKWRCHACNKWAYGSEARALETLGYVSRVYLETGRKIPVRAYRCEHGNGYHLTSKETVH